MQRETYEADPSAYETPTCVNLVMAGPDWGLRHIVEGVWPPDFPAHLWHDVQGFTDYDRTGEKPHGGGMRDQPARWVSVNRALSPILNEIRASEVKINEVHGGAS